MGHGRGRGKPWEPLGLSLAAKISRGLGVPLGFRGQGPTLRGLAEGRPNFPNWLHSLVPSNDRAWGGKRWVEESMHVIPCFSGGT